MHASSFHARSSTHKATFGWLFLCRSPHGPTSLLGRCRPIAGALGTLVATRRAGAVGVRHPVAGACCRVDRADRPQVAGLLAHTRTVGADPSADALRARPVGAVAAGGQDRPQPETIRAGQQPARRRQALHGPWAYPDHRAREPPCMWCRPWLRPGGGTGNARGRCAGRCR